VSIIGGIFSCSQNGMIVGLDERRATRRIVCGWIEDFPIRECGGSFSLPFRLGLGEGGRVGVIFFFQGFNFFPQSGEFGLLVWTRHLQGGRFVILVGVSRVIEEGVK